MDEFADLNRKRAAEWLRPMFQQEVTPGMDPILELIGCLLEDGAGGVTSPVGLQVTTDEWLTWNQFVLSIPKGLSETVAEVLEKEWLGVPIEKELLPNWAACLVLCTLEHMGMR
jgi:hypothetical protein